MRLIDAEKLEEELHSFFGDYSGRTWFEIRNILGEAEEVKAIPIERIKKYMNEQYIEPSYKYNSLFDDWGVAVLTGLIEDWEKENATTD